jgi:S-adenosylmethionine/arginine decarboxylase-like enzyme
MDDAVYLERCLLSVMTQFQDPVNSILVNKFQPQGVSISILSERSRVVTHSWPELGVLTLDVSAPADFAQRMAAACRLALRDSP